LVATAKFFVAASKTLFVVPIFAAVTKPFFSVLNQRSLRLLYPAMEVMKLNTFLNLTLTNVTLLDLTKRIFLSLVNRLLKLLYLSVIQPKLVSVSF